MRNTKNVYNTYKCFACDMKGFFIETPCGADYYTCPCCNKYDFLHRIMNKLEDDNKYEKIFFDDNCDNDLRCSWSYCDTCKIIFEVGCMHYNGGCTSNVYNAHFIKKWKMKDSDIIFEGMPAFDNSDEWFDKANNIIILEKWCPHLGNKCKQGYSNNSICDAHVKLKNNIKIK